MAPQYKLTYFNVRALGEPIRLLFAFKGIEYEDIRIAREDWPEKKQDYPWGSLPVLEEGDKVLAQSNAILRYLAKKHGVNGSDDYEAVKSDELVEATSDVRQAVFKAEFEPDATRKEELVNTLKNETLPKFLKKLESILKSNGTGYFVGNQVTFADLSIVSYLQIINDIHPNTLDAYPNVKQHQDLIFGLDGIKEWVAKRPTTQF